MADLQVKYAVHILLLIAAVSRSAAILNSNYYDKTCPQAENIVYNAVRNATVYDPKVPARILRMFFHDCFIRGCDASVLIDSTPDNQAEKDGPPNVSLAAFYVIDAAKAELESSCPGAVSCADIIAMAARDVVTLSGGPNWSVLKGRKDGRISRANDTVSLPPPSSNASQLILGFSRRGLSTADLVALSGGHTLGFSHCSSFEARLRGFSPAHDADPSLDAEFAAELRATCSNNRDRNAGQFLDPTASVFDNEYYRRVAGGRGVFASDQALYEEPRMRRIVEAFARDQGLFYKEFTTAMVRLGNVGVKEFGEVRANCRAVN